MSCLGFLPSARPKTVIFPPASGGTSGSNYNPRNTQYIPAVIIFAFLDLGKNPYFSFRHYLGQVTARLTERVQSYRVSKGTIYVQ